MRPAVRNFVLLTGAVVLLGSCASSQQYNTQQHLLIPPCPQFELLHNGSFTFDVTPAGDTVALGGGSLLIFAPGAVTDTTRYWVRELLENGTSGPRLAGVDIQVVSGYNGVFNEPVMLRLSYDKCGWSHSGRFFIAMLGPTGPTSEGGSKSEAGNWVQAMVGHFTGFAIAM